MQRLLVLAFLTAPLVAQQQANGIKIGEVGPSSALFWTRATVDAERRADGVPVPRNMKDLPEGVDWDDLVDAVPGMPAEVQIVIGPRGTDGVGARRSGWFPVKADEDYTRTIRIEYLQPGTEYFARSEMRPLGGGEITSTVGATFRTPGASHVPERVSFTVVTGQGFHRKDDPVFGHKISEHMAALAPDFFVHTGDVVYYDKPGPFAKDVAGARYKWNRMYALPLQREFHRRTSCYFLQDDHDTLKDDCWPGQTYGNITWEQGLAIFDEQTPQGDVPYRSVRWGQDLEVWFLEGREFRSPNNLPDGPEKTILGAEQRRWLEQTLRTSTATFRIVISATPIVGPDRKNKRDNHANEGFQAEGDWLRNLMSGQEDCISVCGDRHWQYVSDDPRTGLVEFASGPTSNAHAGGFPSELHDMHRYLRVKGGFLSVTVDRVEGKPVATFRHHDVEGEVKNEVAITSQRNTE